jgi:hypothetical protein
MKSNPNFYRPPPSTAVLLFLTRIGIFFYNIMNSRINIPRMLCKKFNFKLLLREVFG